MEKTKNDHRFHQESKKNNQLKQQRRGLTQKNNQKKSTNIGMKNQFRSNNQKEKTLLKIIK
jgi:small-conductance mechanosensitive channel